MGHTAGDRFRHGRPATSPPRGNPPHVGDLALGLEPTTDLELDSVELAMRRSFGVVTNSELKSLLMTRVTQVERFLHMRHCTSPTAMPS
jgi:hypothetical protein